MQVKDQCCSFQLLLGASQDHSKVYCLWSNELRWSKPHIYAIDFSYSMPESKFSKEQVKSTKKEVKSIKEEVAEE